MDSYTPVPPERTQAPFIVLGLLFFIAVGASVIPASWFGIQPQLRRYAPLNLESLSQPENLANDTNNDGTISWKELAESSLSLTPDQITAQAEADPKIIAILNDPNNLTASFTKNLYITSTALNKGGVTDEKTQQEVVNQLIAKEKAKVTPTTYSASSFSVVPDSKVSIKEYGNKVASAMKGLITEDSIVKDLTSVNSFIKSANEADLLPLTQDATRVDMVIKKLLSIPVPSSATDTHISALVKLTEYKNMLLDLSVINTDALRSTIAIKKHADIVVSAVRIYPLLSNYFNTKNVTFSSSEPGYVYVVGYTGTTR